MRFSLICRQQCSFFRILSGASKYTTIIQCMCLMCALLKEPHHNSPACVSYSLIRSTILHRCFGSLHMFYKVYWINQYLDNIWLVITVAIRIIERVFWCRCRQTDLLRVLGSWLICCADAEIHVDELGLMNLLCSGSSIISSSHPPKSYQQLHQQFQDWSVLFVANNDIKPPVPLKLGSHSGAKFWGCRSRKPRWQG